MLVLTKRFLSRYNNIIISKNIFIELVLLNSTSIINSVKMLTTFNKITNILIHVICNDEQIEKAMFAFKNDDIKCKRFPIRQNQNVSDDNNETFATSFSVTLYHPNNVKLLGDYTNLENSTDMPPLSKPLCLAD